MSRHGAPAAVVDFFDRRAEDYDREYAAQTPGGFALRIRRRKVLELFDDVRGDVLDVGCGPGVMAGEIVARGCRFWGVDPSPSSLSIAARRYRGNPNVQFVRGDAGHLQFADGSFDAVLCMGVLDSVPDGPQAVLEMIRVLKPGGTLILTVPNLLSPYAWWKNYGYYPALERWQQLRNRLGSSSGVSARQRGGVLRTLYSWRGSRQLIHRAGGEVTTIVPYFFNVFISPLDDLLPGAALRLTRRWEQWSRPEWLAAGWIIKARKPSH